MKKLYPLIGLLFMCQACQQQSASTTGPTPTDTTTPPSTAGTEHSAGEATDTTESEDYFPLDQQKAKERPEFTDMAKTILKHDDETADLSYDLKWLKETQKILTAGFNSTYGNMGGITDTEKADLMAKIVGDYFEDNNSYSTLGMLMNGAIQIAFLRYQLVSAYDKLIAQDKAYAKEIESWMKVEKRISSIITKNGHLKYFGGSMARTAGLSNQKRLLEARLNDVQSLMEKHSKDTPVQAKGFTSPDAQLHDLRGNVKRATITTYFCDKKWEPKETDNTITTEFDEEGKARTEYGRFSYEHQSRNDRGQLVEEYSIVPMVEDTEITVKIFTKYEYDQAGTLTRTSTQGGDYTMFTTYTRNKKADIVGITDTTYMEGDKIEDNYTIVIKERDAKGNWTKRLLFVERTSKPDDPNAYINEGEKEYNFKMQERSITYR
ncbi:MAG: hypothetical protein IKP81_09855 [Paludibacteraceae bacterium]|nr:hypothetical protein [Paludibacteraceae bacterium]